MGSDAVKKVQEKLFRGLGVDSTPQQQDRGEPGLKINIPKPPPTPTPPPKLGKQTDSSPKTIEETAPSKSHRERLAQQLGDEYRGVEKYRLLQDGKRERHWKRWGPYLSDRQWVNTSWRFCTIGGCS